MFSEPKLGDRPAQPYVGIRAETGRATGVAELGEVIPRLHSEVLGWLEPRGITPAGPPFIRYHVIAMASRLEVTLGWPVADPLLAEGHIEAGVLPTGRYASLVYTGIDNGIEGNRVLLEWAAENNFELDRWADEHGDAFGARVESFLTDPDDEPDPAKWETEVAIRLADERSGG